MVRLTVDFARQAGSIQLFPYPPLITSHSARWNYIDLEYHHQPPYEIPKSSAPQHIIAIQTEVSTPRQIEGYLAEQFQSVKLTEGDIMLIPANISHMVRWNIEHRFLLLSLDHRYLTQVAYDSINPDRFELSPHFLKSDLLIYQIGLALKAELDFNGGRDLLYVETMAKTLSVHLLKHYSIRDTYIRPHNGGLSKSALKQVHEYINTYLENNLSLSELASLAHLSVSHFSSEFKRLTGVSPYQYVLQLRVERAKKLLTQNQISIAEIAHQVGFANQGHLSYQFKKRYGITPGKMRRQS